MTPVDPGTPTPTGPDIPKGLATKLGVGGGAALAVLAVLAEVFDVQVDTETIAGFAGSVVLLATTMWGRFKQAEAIYKDAPSPFQIVTDFAEHGANFDEFEDYIEETPPAEGELKTDFPEDVPEEPTSSALGMSGDAQEKGA